MSLSLARWWCHLAISSSVIPFSSCLQSFPASGSFQMSQFFTSGGQSIGVSASASVLPVNIQNWFPLRMDWLDLLAVQGTLKSLLQHYSSKASILRCSAFFIVQLSHQYMTRWTSVGKVMSLLFNMLYRLDSEKAMAPHSSTLAWKISWTEEPGMLQSMRSLRVRHDWATSLLLSTFMHCRRKWQPTPVFLLGESPRQRSLVGGRLWGCTELDTTEVT